ncbi:hypothetical protein PW035_12585 [Nonomuraea angiospora]|nr:hypothetical protein [Nonomuraea angiospora]MDX3101671.1 hypothetical protein [Nonomuraea angiospora]
MSLHFSVTVLIAVYPFYKNGVVAGVQSQPLCDQRHLHPVRTVEFHQHIRDMTFNLVNGDAHGPADLVIAHPLQQQRQHQVLAPGQPADQVRVRAAHGGRGGHVAALQPLEGCACR